jgi:diguanylate cyclase (GGDEF)-like protein/PAS domain S-box-containing protein
MSPPTHAGVALQPIMDLEDRRIIAYQARQRACLPDPAEFLPAALACIELSLGVPLLVPLSCSLADDRDLDISGLSRDADIHADDVVWMLDVDPANSDQPTVQARAAMLTGLGFRVALDSVDVRDLSWQAVTAVQPSFLCLDSNQFGDIEDLGGSAALAGVLAFTSRIGCRVVAQGVDSSETAGALMQIGVFYGSGTYLEHPVVIDPASAVEGDQVVDRSWFEGKAIRRLRDMDAHQGADAGGQDIGSDEPESRRVIFLPSPAPIDITASSDEAMAQLVAEAAARFFPAETADLILSGLADIVPRAVRFDRFAIFEADWTTFVLKPRILVGGSLAPLVDMAYPLGTGITGWAFLRGTPYNCGLTIEHSEAAPIPGEPDSEESLMVIPLISGGRRFGAMDIWRDGIDQFSGRDLERCSILGQLAADALRHCEDRHKAGRRSARAGRPESAPAPGVQGADASSPPLVYPAPGMAEEHRRLSEAQQVAQIGSFEVGLDDGVHEWSPELRRILGVPLDTPADPLVLIERVHHEDVQDFGTSLGAWISGGAGNYSHTIRVARPDGSVRSVSINIRVRGKQHRRRLLGTVQDVTDRVRSEEVRRIAEEQFSLAFDHATIGMITTTLDRVITRVNPAACEILGRDAETIIGQRPDDFYDPADLAGGQYLLNPGLLVSPSGKVSAERRFLRPDGTPVVVNYHLSLVRDTTGEPQYVFAQMENVTERKRQEEEIRRLALEDPLTGLPNRQLLHDRLARSMQRARQTREPLAVVLVDIDHFKRVNDSRGPAAGDRLLMQAARRMADGMRAQDTVARLSGDEFVLLCESVDDIDHAVLLSQRLEALFNTPFLLDDDEISLSVSCGIRLAVGYETPEDVLRDAEAAMHIAKERGRNRSEVFDESIRTRATGRFDLETALRHAVDNRDIYVVFQPIVTLPDEAVIGLEALARWSHPERGLVNPAEFIPIAEDIGLIGALGESMLDAALEQLARWREQMPMQKSLYVAVNLSPKQLVAADLLAKCLATLDRYGLEPSSLRLEVTETVLMDDAELSTSILRRLSESGIRIAMDDFGTGFSSLSRLKQLPVSTLKVDRSFIDGLGTDPSDSSIVRAIVSLGHALNLELCAEGVELPHQRDELIMLGCHHAQGYLWSRPVAAADLTNTFAA